MLGHPAYPAVPIRVISGLYGVHMIGDNPPGADNQQETKESPLDPIDPNEICGEEVLLGSSETIRQALHQE